MKRRNIAFTTILILLSCFMLLPIAHAGGQSRPSPTPGTQDVNVVNTPNVNVANTPSVSLVGTPTVNLGANNSVNVSNSADAPVLVRDVDTAARTPFYASIPIGLPAGDLDDESFSIDIPAGKTLVAEFVSVLLVNEAGDQIRYVTIIGAGGEFGERHILVTHSPGGCPTCTDTVVSQQIQINATSFITIGVTRLTANGSTGGTANITGYLVNTP